MTTTTLTRTRCADLEEHQHVRLVSPFWRGWFGVVAYVGADRVEVYLVEHDAVIPFLPSELEPADGPARA
jgi:hypothetical protein